MAVVLNCQGKKQWTVACNIYSKAARIMDALMLADGLYNVVEAACGTSN